MLNPNIQYRMRQRVKQKPWNIAIWVGLAVCGYFYLHVAVIIFFVLKFAVR